MHIIYSPLGQSCNS